MKVTSLREEGEVTGKSGVGFGYAHLCTSGQEMAISASCPFL